MRVLFDTNVILDLLLMREPYWRDAGDLASKVERGEILGVLCSTTITTLHCLISRATDGENSRRQIAHLLRLYEIAPVTRSVLSDAIALPFSDFEDEVIHEAGRHAGVECIVTRDSAGFKDSRIPVLAPKNLLALLAEETRNP